MNNAASRRQRRRTDRHGRRMVDQRCPRCAATNPASAQLCGQCWAQLGPSPTTAWTMPGPPLLVGDVPAQQLAGGLAALTLGVAAGLLLPEWPAVFDTDQFRVVHLDESPPQLGAAFVRALVLTVLGVIPLALLICAVVMERDRRRQGWHDRAAGTFVIATRTARRW